MHRPAKLFLSLRALGAPANVIMLAVQGIFRGFKDTKTPVFYIGNNQEILYIAIALPFPFMRKLLKPPMCHTDFEISPKGVLAKAHPCTSPHCKNPPHRAHARSIPLMADSNGEVRMNWRRVHMA
jgi:hypothetical protein